MTEELSIQYVALPSVAADQTTLGVYPCREQPRGVVAWIHGGGWLGGDRRHTRGMPIFFGAQNYLFISVNYPIQTDPSSPLIELQIEALKGLNTWLTKNELRDQYPDAFNNITLLAHSSGSHLVALNDKLHGWGADVSCLFLMDASAYDLQARWRLSGPMQRNTFSILLGLEQRPVEEHQAILRSYSPALLPPQPRPGTPLKVVIVTSQRPGARYSGQRLAQSYTGPGYNVSLHCFPWEHAAFPDAVGAESRLNQLLIQAIAPQ